MAEKVTAVIAKVISQRGTCAFGHKVGDTARITEAGVEGRICIHALYSMFPAAFAMLYDVKFPWLSNTETKTHPCTDVQNPVVFELTKVRTSSVGAQQIAVSRSGIRSQDEEKGPGCK